VEDSEIALQAAVIFSNNPSLDSLPKEYLIHSLIGWLAEGLFAE
jgi:hypothetical protein